MLGAMMMGGTLAAVLHTAYVLWMYGMTGLSALEAVRMASSTGMGRGLLEGGLSEVAFGMGVQWVFALASSFVFLLLSYAFPAMLRSAMLFGPLYGLAVFGIMTYALPMWAGAAFSAPPLASLATDALAQALLFGLPMAMTGRMMMSPR